MSLKEEYNKALATKNKIRTLKEDLQEESVYLKALDTTREHVQSSTKYDLSDRITRLNYINGKIEEYYNELYKYNVYARNLIDSADLSLKEYDVMFYKYLMFKSPQEIADKMGYTCTNMVFKLHKRALKKIENS